MANVILMYRVDIGFNPEKGYGAAVYDVLEEKQKGIRGHSIEQLASRLRHVLIEAEGRKRKFPLEHGEPSRIITLNGD